MSESFDCIVVGAGLSGLAAARALQDAGLSVCILEKARGVGGRMATRRLEGESFDHGAQFFTTRGDAMKSICKDWVSRGLAKAWFGEAGRERFCGLPSMNALAKDLATGLLVCNQMLVTGLVFDDEGVLVSSESGDSFRAQSVLLTCPAPQAVALLERSEIELEEELMGGLRSVRYERCVALLGLFEEVDAMLPSAYSKIESDDCLMTLVDVKRKGTSARGGFVAHAKAGFSELNYDMPKEFLEAAMLDAVRRFTSAAVAETYLHKWKFALRLGPEVEHGFLRSKLAPVWFAGDSYGAAKVEGAFESGLAAAASILGAR